MKILLATHNEGKLRESRAIFKELLENVEVIGLKEAGIMHEVEETEDTLEGNAILKAKEIYDLIKDDENFKHIEFDYIVSEDLGFFIEAFKDVAGVHAKRWYGGSDDDRQSAVLDLFIKYNKKNRNASYRTVFVAVDKEGNITEATGELKGEIATVFKGNNGFGYDKIFVMPDGKHTAELSLEEKNKNSSRRKAITNLIAKIS